MLDALLQLAEAVTVTQVRWDSAPAAWQIFLIGALVLAFAAATYLLEPRGQRQNLLKVPLTLVRAVIVLLAIGVLFRPLESKELQDVKDGVVVVVIDTSRSMGFLDRERDEKVRIAEAEQIGVSPERRRELDRLNRVKAALRNKGGAILRELAEKNAVRLFTFDSTRKRIADIPKTEKDEGKKREDGTPADAVADALAALEAVPADGQATAVGDALQRILTDLRSERVAGVVLLTDGRSNAGSISAEAVAARFGRKGVQIYAVGVGDPEPPRDLSVDDFRAPDVSLAGDVLRGSFVVRADGYTEPRECRVRVRLDQEQIYEGTVKVGGKNEAGAAATSEATVDFTTKVTRPGEYTLEATVEPDPDELTPDNNRAVRRLRVIDERIRVLYLEGYPRWEYRYIKNALCRDRHMQVQVFLLSADPEFHQEHSDNVAPLTQVPTPEQLLDYHVIVLGDVNPQARSRTGDLVFKPGFFEAMAELVKDRGGGLLMVSGEQSSPRAYAGTPIEDLLPVVIDQNGGRGQDYTRAWRPRLTREGYESPLMRLEPTEEESRQLWDVGLPDLYWYVPTEKAKPQARVLAVHPRDKNQAGPYTLAAWHRFGSGTCFWLGFDEAWRWRAQVGDKYHYRFYGQILRFLSLQSFTRSKRFFVTTDKTQYDVGEDVKLRAEIRDRDAGAERPTQEVIIDLPDGQNVTVTLKALPDEQGKFEGTWKPLLVGAYRAHIDPGGAGSSTEVASRLFEVKLPRLELQEPRMDQEGLERLATASGGKFLRLGELKTVPEQIPLMTETYRGGRSETELWDKPWVFMLLFGLLLVEWIGRKLLRLL